MSDFDLAQRKFAEGVENLYAVFGRYKPPKKITGCSCCIDSVNPNVLHSKPLRSLEIDDVSRFAWKAMTTVGDVRDFKHFLPRMLELYIDPHWLDNREVLAGKLQLADWLTWPDSEKEAVHRYLLALWNVELERHSPVMEIAELLAIIEIVNDELSEYLSLWRSLASPPARRRLLSLLFGTSEPETGNWEPSYIDYTNAFVRDPDAQARRINSWLSEHETIQAIERCSQVCGTPEAQSWLNTAVHWLRESRSA